MGIIDPVTKGVDTVVEWAPKIFQQMIDPIKGIVNSLMTYLKIAIAFIRNQASALSENVEKTYKMFAMIFTAVKWVFLIILILFILNRIFVCLQAIRQYKRDKAIQKILKTVQYDQKSAEEMHLTHEHDEHGEDRESQEPHFQMFTARGIIDPVTKGVDTVVEWAPKIFQQMIDSIKGIVNSLMTYLKIAIAFIRNLARPSSDQHIDMYKQEEHVVLQIMEECPGTPQTPQYWSTEK
jgi:predicted PurR-regulated permease PerM